MKSTKVPTRRAKNFQFYRYPGLHDCPQCYRRKVRCDQSFPSCKNCTTKGINCGYLDFVYKKEQSQAQQIKSNIDSNNFQGTELNIDLCHLERYTLNQDNNVVNNTTDYSTFSGNQSSTTLSNTISSITNFQSINNTYEKSHNGLSTQIQNHIESSNHKFEIPLINHFTSIHSQINHFKKLQSTNNARQQFEQDMIRELSKYIQTPTLYLSLSLIVVHQFKDSRTLDGIILLSYGALLPIHHKELLPFFLNLQSTCINHILEKLEDLNDLNIIPILTVAISLDLSSYVLTEEIGYDQRSKFSNGPISILKTAYQDPRKFPKSFPILRTYDESVYQIY